MALLGKFFAIYLLALPAAHPAKTIKNCGTGLQVFSCHNLCHANKIDASAVAINFSALVPKISIRCA